MRVCLLGFTIPDAGLQEIMAADRCMPSQTHGFAWSLVEALRHAGLEIRLLSVWPVSNFPGNPRVLFRSAPFQAKGVSGEYLGFVNLLGLKHLTRFLQCLTRGTRMLRRWRPSVLLVHGVHSPFLGYAVIGRRLLGLTVVVVLTDPPGVELPSDRLVARLLKRLDVRLVRRALRWTDAVVAVTKDLADDFAPGKPALVIDGIASGCARKFVEGPASPGWMARKADEGGVPGCISTEENAARRRLGGAGPDELPGVTTMFEKESTAERANRARPTVIYAGSLRASNGVDRLLDAVVGLTDLPVRLEVYGAGELAGRVSETAATHAEVVGPRLLSREDLSAAYRSADLLVQPRPTDQDFVRYSFPSKIIEYLASGVPVLTTRLASLSDEYAPYVYWIDDDSVAGIRQALRDVLRLPEGERWDKGRRAARHIRFTRSSEARGRGIAAFLRCVAANQDRCAAEQREDDPASG